MTVTIHPREMLTEEWVHIIRRHSAGAEAAGQLHPVQLSLMYAQHWFTLLTPKAYNGLEWPLPDVVKLEEAIAWADGSMAWVLTLCAGAGWFGGFLQPETAQQFFANPQVCLAGSGAATGHAEITGNGYMVNGSWLHASGAPHATVFTANCVLTHNGETVTDQQGKPVIRPFAFLKEEVEQLHTWQSFGLVATASHAFTIKNKTVPAERSFLIDAKSAIAAGPLYQYPFLQLAECTLAANISGMCLHFMEEATAILQHSSQKNAFAVPVLEKSKELLQTRRASFYEVLESSWQQLLQGSINNETLAAISMTARQLALDARKTVDELYPYCGLQAAAKNTVINRVWRDIHTASQHSLLVYPAAE